ncbi:MAG: hypothetical protein SP1CHLAM54_06680 [Chlamydiia bacterium]|nr:hypothetical protein [Chlamydiia bacterium]MCH9615577.1 hypothetical protein [Chlamydiia bacterium]MCH9629232.1 hypothetical protein [Chlamydiia bacterium]
MLTSDHSKFYLKGEPFIPLVFDGEEFDEESGFNTTVVKLDATLNSPLDWKIPEVKGYVIYEMDFGLNQPNFSLSDPMPLSSFKVALDHLVDNVICEKTLGVILYRGDGNFSKCFDWKTEYDGPMDDPYQVGLFANDCLAYYLHQLAAVLPDEVAPIALMDATYLTNAETAFLLSKDRFTHINLAIKGNSVPLWGMSWENGASTSGYIGRSSFFEASKSSNLGLLFPQDKKITRELLGQINQLLEMTSIRVIPEVMMPENWDGLDGLIAFKDGLTNFGKRVLSGFEATGGRTMVYTAVSDSASLSSALSDFLPVATSSIADAKISTE